MPRESEYPKSEATENLENGPAFSVEAIQWTIKQFLEKRRAPDNSGTNALILKLFNNELPANMQEVMAAEGENGQEGSLSLKVLKIFNPGDAKKEYQALKRANKIVQGNEGGAPIAKIPHAYGFYDIPIEKDFKEFLNQNGAAIIGDHVGVVIMDYIEGEDLAGVLQKELQKIYPSSEESDFSSDITDLSFERLYQALERSDFVLPESIVGQIENAVKALHQQGLYHNDLHLRNVILRDADLRAENPQTYIIDFATATYGEPASEDSPTRLSDENIIARLSPLTKSAESKKEKHLNEEKEEWSSRVQEIERNPRLQKRKSEIKDVLESGKKQKLESYFNAASSIDKDFESFLGILFALCREDEKYRDTIKNLIDEQSRNSTRRAFLSRAMRSWKEAIGI